MGTICLCCTSQNLYLIPIKNCKHTTFLETNLDFKFNFNNAHICSLCHNMLKKIDLFKLQVEESIAFLNGQTHTVNLNKLHNLTCSLSQITDSTKLLPYMAVKSEVVANQRVDSIDNVEKHDDVNDVENFDTCKFLDIEFINKEIDNIETDHNIQTEIKSEHLSSDSESDKPLAKVKTVKKERYIEKYEGKIKTLTLTVEEVQAEREAMTKEGKYTKFKYKCEYCIVGFEHDLNWKSHMEKRHTIEKNKLQCDICMCVLNNKPSYNNHIRSHFLRYECVECGKRYHHEYSAIEHYSQNHLPAGSSLLRTHTCPHCGFTTTHMRHYRYHLEKHKKLHECKICGNTFVTSSCLKTHLFTVHAQSSHKYRCEACAKTYRARSGLAAHARLAHAGAPPAYCAACRTHFTNERVLRTHLATHSNHVSDTDKRYICDECGAKFVRKNSLQVHINWEHLKISTNRCTKCSKIFKTDRCLQRHINSVHNKQRPPRDKICHFCGRAFTMQKILESHLRTHTGERPLHCKHCPATFAHSGALYTHVKLKHNGLNKLIT